MKFEENTETYNKKIGMLASIFIHLVLLLFILFSPPLTRDLPLPGYEGIMVRFGDIDEGTEQNVEVTDSRPMQNKESTVEKPKSNLKIEETPTSDKEKISINNQAAKNTKPATRAPDPSANEIEDYSKFFKSKNKKSSSGVQGDPLGSRDSDILEGISKGKGKVGDGLDARGVMYEPLFEDSSQKSGTVVVRLCIDDEGKVISARYTQKGSTTTDSELINIAVSNSKKYRFSPSQLPEQCGTVSIVFIVR